MQVENLAKGAIRQSVKQIRAAKYQRREESPPTLQTWAEQQRGRGPDPPRNRPHKGGREVGPPGCGHTPEATI